jgi:peptidoglycan/LPS O-acetylase OafA/YrhL
MQTGFRRPTSARRAGSARSEPWSLPASSSYEPALDGLRAVSILFVVLSHAGLAGIMPANFGVTIFFFISGFLISRLLLAEHGRRGHISLGRFYMRRFLRLMPALILYVAVAGAIFSLLGYRLVPTQYASALLYWANYYGIYLDDVGGGFAVWPHADVQSPFAILWSLAVEEHFYLVFPALLLLFAKRLRLLLYLVVALCALALVWRYVFLAIHCADPASAVCDWAQYHNERASDARFDSIFYGVLAALILNASPHRYLAIIARPAMIIAALALLAAALVVRDPIFRASLRYTLEGVALMAIVPAILYVPLAVPARAILSWAPMLYIGRLSYTLYLFHWLGKNLAHDFAPVAYSWHWYGIFVPVTAIATLSCYHLLEVPIVGLRRRFGSNAPPEAVPHADSAPAAASAMS